MSDEEQNNKNNNNNNNQEEDDEGDEVEVGSVGVGPDGEEEEQQNKENENEGDENGEQNQEEEEQQQEEQEEVKKCDRCETNKSTLEEQQKAAEKLSSQNQRLKVDLEELKNAKQEVEIKIQEKEKEKHEKVVDPEERKLQKQINEVNVQFVEYKNKIAHHQHAMDTDKNFEKALVIQNDTKILEEEIERIKQMNKQLDQDRKDNEHAIQLRNAEFVDQKRTLDSEVKKQKTILTKLRIKNRDYKIEMLVQQEFLVRLEEKHREVCETYGQSSSMIQTRIDHLGKLIEVNHSRKLKEQEKEDRMKEEKGYTAENYRAKRQEIKDLIQKKKKEANDGDEDVKNLEAKIKFAQREQTIKLFKLKEKEQELNMALLKIQELQKHTKHNQLQPLVIESRMDRHQKFIQSQQNIKNFKLNASTDSIRSTKGGVSFLSESAQTITDADQLPKEKDYRISNIEFFYIQDMIMGMRVIYKRQLNNEKIKIDTFLPKNLPFESLETKSISFTASEYITQLYGYTTKETITYLEIITSRGGKLQVGNEKKTSKTRKFQLNIKADERPISFFISVDTPLKITEDQKYQQSNDILEESMLVSIGLECKKKEVNQSLYLSGNYIIKNKSNSKYNQVNSSQDLNRNKKVVQPQQQQQQRPLSNNNNSNKNSIENNNNINKQQEQEQEQEQEEQEQEQKVEQDNQDVNIDDDENDKQIEENIQQNNNNQNQDSD